MSTGTSTDFMQRDAAAKMPGDPWSTLIAGLVGNEADRETSRAGTVGETTGSIAGQRWPEMSPTAKTYSEGAIVRGCGRGICSG